MLSVSAALRPYGPHPFALRTLFSSLPSSYLTFSFSFWVAFFHSFSLSSSILCPLLQALRAQTDRFHFELGTELCVAALLAHHLCYRADIGRVCHVVRKIIPKRIAFARPELAIERLFFAAIWRTGPAIAYANDKLISFYFSEARLTASPDVLLTLIPMVNALLRRHCSAFIWIQVQNRVF